MTAEDHWFRNAVFYEIDVSRFADGNGDGFGDFPGLTGKIDYLRDLGVDCVWLLPFYLSPRRDDGYDVADHYHIDPRLGDIHDFRRFVHRAKERGIRILIDVVMDHTSNEHLWFQAAQADKESRYHGYYSWSRAPVIGPEGTPVFPGEVDSVWTWDEQTGEYYYHRFYPFEPDLALRNPMVQEEVHRLLDFWLAFGVDGFRIDALPLMVQPPGQQIEDPDVVLADMRGVLAGREPDAILLAEANLLPKDLPEYMSNGQHCDMLEDFMMRGRILLALARGSSRPLHDGLELLPAAPTDFQWLTLLGSHDELDFEKMPDGDKQEIFRTFSPDPRTHIFGRGLRRRIAPLLGSRARLELVTSLQFTLPGTPLILYGDELGLGDDLSQPGRSAARVLMQWDGGRNGGFSSADQRDLVSPPLPSGPFGYEQGVSVAGEEEDPSSLLNWFRRLIAARKRAPEIGAGQWSSVDTDNDAMFGVQWSLLRDRVIAVHNLSEKAQRGTVRMPTHDHRRYRLVLGSVGKHEGEELELPPLGYAWWRLG